MHRLYQLVAVAGIAVLLALGAFAGYLAATGRLTIERLERVAAVLRGEDENAAHDALSAVADAHASATTQPAAEPGRGPSAAELRRARLAEHMQRATLERAAADLQARQALLNQSMQHLIQLQEQFGTEKTAWLAQKKKLTDVANDGGFQRELAYVTKLQPKYAKEHVVRTWQKQKADAVRLFMALEPSKGQRILEQLKTPEELQIMHELLEQLRAADVDNYVTGSGRTSSHATP